MGDGHKETPISLDDSNGNGFTGEFVSLGNITERRVEGRRKKFKETLSEKKMEESRVEAKKRGIELEQWLALLHVTAAADKGPEWIDEIFTFSGDGKIRVGGNLDLRGRVSLNYLPKGLEIGGRLDLSGCTNLISLPDDIRVGTYLLLDGCSSLQYLPYKLESGTISIMFCTALEMLPRELIANGDLHIIGCSALVTPPRKLMVGGNLYLTGCPALITFPKDATIVGDVILKDINEDALRRIHRLKKEKKIIGIVIHEEYKYEDEEDEDSNPPER